MSNLRKMIDLNKNLNEAKAKFCKAYRFCRIGKNELVEEDAINLCEKLNDISCFVVSNEDVFYFLKKNCSGDVNAEIEEVVKMIENEIIYNANGFVQNKIWLNRMLGKLNLIIEILKFYIITIK